MRGKAMKSVWISMVMVMLLVLSAVPAYAEHDGPGEGEELGVDVTIDSVARQRGALVVTGSIVCEQTAEAGAYIYAMQTVGRWHTVEGDGGTDLMLCGPTPIVFSATITAQSGKYFQGGRVQIYAEAFACSPGFPDYEQYKGEELEFRCGWDFAESTAKVRPAHR